MLVRERTNKPVVLDLREVDQQDLSLFILEKVACVSNILVLANNSIVPFTVLDDEGSCVARLVDCLFCCSLETNLSQKRQICFKSVSAETNLSQCLSGKNSMRQNLSQICLQFVY